MSDTWAVPFSIVASGAFAWLGVFLLTRTAVYLDETTKPTPMNILMSLLRQPTRAGLYLSATVILIAVFLIVESLRLQGAPVARAMALFMILAPATWAAFTSTFHDDEGWIHAHRKAVDLSLLCCAIFLTFLWAFVRAEVSVETRVAISLLVGLWTTGLLAWGLWNLALIGDDQSRTWLLTAGTLGSLAAAFFGVAGTTGNGAWHLAGQALLCCAGVSIFGGLERHGLIEPLTEPKRHRDLVRSSRVIVSLSLLYAGLVGLALSVIETNPSLVLLMIFVTVTITHSILDAIWSLLSVEEEELARRAEERQETGREDYQRRIEATEEYYRSRAMMQDTRLYAELHGYLKTKLGEVIAALQEGRRDQAETMLKDLRDKALEIRQRLSPGRLSTGTIYDAVREFRLNPAAQGIGVEPDSGEIRDIDMSELLPLHGLNFHPPEVTEDACLVIQEGLINAARHNKGRHVWVRIGGKYSGSELRVWVRTVAQSPQMSRPEGRPGPLGSVGEGAGRLAHEFVDRVTDMAHTAAHPREAIRRLFRRRDGGVEVHKNGGGIDTWNRIVQLRGGYVRGRKIGDSQFRLDACFTKVRCTD